MKLERKVQRKRKMIGMAFAAFILLLACGVFTIQAYRLTVSTTTSVLTEDWKSRFEMEKMEEFVFDMRQALPEKKENAADLKKTWETEQLKIQAVNALGQKMTEELNKEEQSEETAPLEDNE